jgi:cation:H+ antiporter
MLPVVYAISAGQISPMHMDARQVEEMLLTAAQSLFAVAILANLSFSLGEALIIFVLFTTQLLIPDPAFRYYYSYLYIALAIGMAALRKDAREGIIGLFSRGSAFEAAKEK